MATQLWSVWIRNSVGWRWLGNVSKAEADKFAAECETDRLRYLVHPRHAYTAADVIEG